MRFATIHVARFGDAKCVFHNEEDAAVGQSLTDRNSGAASSGDTRRKVRLVGHEGASTQAMCEGFGVNAERRADPDGRDDAGVDIAVDTCSAEAEKLSNFCNRERPLNSFDLVGQGNRWVGRISHLINDNSAPDKLTQIVRPYCLESMHVGLGEEN